MEKKAKREWSMEKKAKGTAYDIIIVGAGASGMMAAISAARELGRTAGILLLEKNDKVGKKLLATGNGRCNFTNARCTSSDYDGGFLTNKETADFPDEVMFKASPEHIMEEFSRMGVVPREEEEGRVYPYSGQGASLCQALQFELKRLGVEIRYDSVVKKLEKSDAKEEPLFTVKTAERLTGTEQSRHCHRLILATGGKAGGQYGSEGDGYQWAKALGHKIVKPIPALVQLLTDDRDFLELKGVRAKGVATLYEDNNPVESDKGEIQFTENGLSGICIFNLSRRVRYDTNPMESKMSYNVRIDFVEEKSQGEVYELLRERRANLSERPAVAFLDGLVHAKLSAVLMKRCGVSKGAATGQLTEGQLKSLALELTGFDVRVIGTKSWKDAQVTAGGVDTSEVERGTLQSLLVPGLYFSGELLDVDGPCGGYNLQWAFASGLVSGKAVAESL